jgi:hypothetical protein
LDKPCASKDLLVLLAGVDINNFIFFIFNVPAVDLSLVILKIKHYIMEKCTSSSERDRIFPIKVDESYSTCDLTVTMLHAWEIARLAGIGCNNKELHWAKLNICIPHHVQDACDWHAFTTVSFSDVSNEVLFTPQALVLLYLMEM